MKHFNIVDNSITQCIKQDLVALLILKTMKFPYKINLFPYLKTRIQKYNTLGCGN